MEDDKKLCPLKLQKELYLVNVIKKTVCGIVNAQVIAL